MTHESADSSTKTTVQRKRRCSSMAAETDTISEYELERIKRVKANLEVLKSLGFETHLPKIRRQPRKKPPILLRVREEDNGQPGMGSMGVSHAASEEEGDDQPRREPAAQVFVSTSAPVLPETRNATGGVVGEGVPTDRASCVGGVINLGSTALCNSFLSLDMSPRVEIQQGISAGHQVQGRKEIEGQGAGDAVGAKGADADVLRSARNKAGCIAGKRRRGKDFGRTETLRVSSLRQRKDAIWTPFISRKRSA